MLGCEVKDAEREWCSGSRNCHPYLSAVRAVSVFATSSQRTQVKGTRVPGSQFAVNQQAGAITFSIHTESLNVLIGEMDAQWFTPRRIHGDSETINKKPLYSTQDYMFSTDTRGLADAVLRLKPRSFHTCTHTHTANTLRLPPLPCS